MAPLSPFFLASLLNASRTDTYVVDIPYFSFLLEDNTQRKETESWTLIRDGSTMLHNQVEGEYNYNFILWWWRYQTKYDRIISSARQVRNILGSVGTWPTQYSSLSAIMYQTIIGNSSAMVTGFPQQACLRRIMSSSRTLYMYDFPPFGS